MALTDVLLKTYSITQKSGLLELPPVKALFVRSYDLYKRHYEDPFYSLINRHPEFFEGGHILDLGANIGYTAELFAEAVDDGFQVFAFEPEKENCQQFQKRITARDMLGFVELVPALVGKEKGEARLWFNEDHHADHRVATEAFASQDSSRLKRVSTVPMWSVDSFVEQRLQNSPVSFIKIDVQGFELPVLQGMQQTMRRNQNVTIALEYAPPQIAELGFDPLEVLSEVEELGFEVYHLEIRKPLRKLERSQLIEIADERGYLDLLLKR